MGVTQLGLGTDIGQTDKSNSDVLAIANKCSKTADYRIGNIDIFGPKTAKNPGAAAVWGPPNPPPL